MLESGADTSGAKNLIRRWGLPPPICNATPLKAALLAAARDDDSNAKPKPKAEPMSQEDFTILRRNASTPKARTPIRVEDFLTKKFGVDAPA